MNEVIKQNKNLSNLIGDVAITAPAQYDHLEFNGSSKWANTINLTMSGDIIPNTTNTHSLGTQAKRFSAINASNLTAFTKAVGGGTETVTNSTAGNIASGSVTSSAGTALITTGVNAGNFATGVAVSLQAGKTASISTAGGTGAFAHGKSQTYATANFDGTILASGIGSFAGGYVNTYSTTGGTSGISATGPGCVAHGFALEGAILAGSGQGAVAFGQATSSGNITASGSGSFAIGSCATGGTNITANGTNTFQFAPGVNSTATSLQVGDTTTTAGATKNGVMLRGATSGVDAIKKVSAGTGANTFTHTGSGFAGGTIQSATGKQALLAATGAGTICVGVSNANGSYAGAKAANLHAYGAGSFAMGYAISTGAYANIWADNTGSFAFGVATGGSIKARNSGSVAIGVANPGGLILSDGGGSFAMGFASGQQIGRLATGSAMGQGSFAFGNATSAAITAFGLGSLAFGSASATAAPANTAIIANAENAFQFGPGTNATASSLQVGDIRQGNNPDLTASTGVMLNAANANIFGVKRILTTTGAQGKLFCQSPGVGAFAIGSFRGAGGGTFTASGEGCMAFGTLLTTVATAAKIISAGKGSIAGGYVNSVGYITAGSGTSGTGFAFGTAGGGYSITTGAYSGSVAIGQATGGHITANDSGCFAMGFSVGAGSGQIAIQAGANNGSRGAFAMGLTTTSTSIKATAAGSFAFGSATANIAASAINSFQFGPGTNATAFSLQVGTGIFATAAKTSGIMLNATLGGISSVYSAGAAGVKTVAIGKGSIVGGYLRGGSTGWLLSGDQYASSGGCLVVGHVYAGASGQVSARGIGSWAGGSVYTSGVIDGGGRGSFAFGQARTKNIKTLADGCFSLGIARGGDILAGTAGYGFGAWTGGYTKVTTGGAITATKNGSFSFGFASDAAITASGEGSLAIGKATAAIIANQINSFQFGPGTNGTAQSLQIMDATSTGLILKPTATISNTANDITISAGPGAGASNKTMLLATTVFDDIVVPLTVQSGADKPPSWVKYKDNGAGSLGTYMWQFQNASTANQNSVYFNVEMPHKKKLGTALNIHVHFVTDSGANTNVVWGLEYQWVKIGDAFATNNTLITETVASIGTTANTHIIVDLVDIAAPANETVSSMLVGRFYRASGNASDTFESNNVWLMGIGIHYEIDTIGSRQEFVK